MSKARRLTRAEQETIISTSEADLSVSIYTFNKRLARRLEAYSKKYPHLCQLSEAHRTGAVTYEMDKSRFSVRLVPPISEKRKAQLREQLEEQRTRKLLDEALEECTAADFE